MVAGEEIPIREFAFGPSREYALRCRARKLLRETLNFRSTLQCEIEDLFEFMRGFGGGWVSDDEGEGQERGNSGGTTDEASSASFQQEAEKDERRKDSNRSENEKPDLLGLDVWPAALELCEYLADNPSIVKGRRHVVELGAGVGLPGLLAAKLGACSVTLTDYEQRVVDQSINNAMLSGVGCQCSGLLLDWRDLRNLPSSHAQKYSLILAADVLYVQDLMVHFVCAVLKLLEPHNGVVLIAHQNRRALVITDDGPEMKDTDVAFRSFLDLCSLHGLTTKELGRRKSPGFPGPMLLLAAALNSTVLESVPKAKHT